MTIVIKNFCKLIFILGRINMLNYIKLLLGNKILSRKNKRLKYDIFVLMQEEHRLKKISYDNLLLSLKKGIEEVDSQYIDAIKLK